MIGKGASPSFSGADNVVQLLAALNDPAGVKKRLAELEAATRKYEKMRDEANRAAEEAQYESTQHLAKERELHAREENLKTQIQAHQHDKDGTAADHARITSDLAGREKALKDGKAKLAQDVNDFAHYREREKAALQRQHAELDKRAESLKAEHNELASGKRTVEAAVTRLGELRDAMIAGLKGII